jgi:hypothetical protein
MMKIKTMFVLLACCALVGAQDRSDTSPPLKPPRPQMIRVSAGVLYGLVDHMEPPKYPEEALKSRTQREEVAAGS